MARRQESHQQTMFDAERPATGDSEPVTCLGMTFSNDEDRRRYFLEKLREKLKDPEFRKIGGFPIGSDEDILALSDPPYYTACPNPWLANFVAYYGRPYDPDQPYHREPFAVACPQARPTPSTRPTATTPRFPIWPSCHRFCTTPSREMSCWTDLPVPA